MSSGKSSARAKSCRAFQDEMARTRERDFRHNQLWKAQARYYDHWEKANTKFEEWTSPRYYETSNDLIEKLRREREHAAQLERRRSSLKKLLDEEEASYRIEMMAVSARSMSRKFDEIPTELLKDMNVGLKLAEDERRRREAELQLYNQWRNNNPEVRNAERCKGMEDLKLSWLDQQIEKRMLREREEEECRRALKVQNENIEREMREEESMLQDMENKRKQLAADLERQMEEIKLKQVASEELKKQEDAEIRNRQRILQLEEEVRLKKQTHQANMCALYNLKQYKMKLKKMGAAVEENLNQEMRHVEDILKCEATERIRNEGKRREIRNTLNDFLEFSRKQKALEKRRQDNLNLIFDSEAKIMFEKQQEIWSQEENARRKLLDDVLKTVKEQIEFNVNKSKEEQKTVLEERERILEDMERHERELEQIKTMEERKRREFKDGLDTQVREKQLKQKQLKEMERRNTDRELEKIKMEEERLRKEILKVQNSHAPVRYLKSKRWI